MCVAAGTRAEVAVAPEGALPDGVFARIDDETVSLREFAAFFRQYLRSKLFHNASDARIAELQREAIDGFIDLRLVAHEAERRGILADEAAVEREIAALRARYEGGERWQQFQQELPLIRRRLLEESASQSLERIVRNVPEPDEETLRAYYEANRDKFTEPRRDHVAVILIHVPPWESQTAWEEARRRLERLRRKITDGASFAALAREHSTHESAERGGDLGFVHRGGFVEEVQTALDAIAPGEVTPPVRLLEGYALFHLMAREPARLNPFEKVRERARALYLRDSASEAWRAFLAALRRKARITLAPLPTPGSAPGD